MSGKPDLPVLPNIQNVVVYVSDDNFAQSYSEKPRQNVQPTLQPPLPPSNFHDHPQHFQVQNQAQHMAAIVRQQKIYQQDKQAPIKTVTYSSSDSNEFLAQQRECYVNSQNGIHHPLSHNAAYQNNAVVNQVKFNVCNSDLPSSERHGGVPGRLDLKMQEDCDARDNYVDVNGGYVTVRSIEGPSQSVRCESVRSETAESSCSSLSSSTDEGVVIVQNQAPEMVVYDPGVCVRPGGVVVAVGSGGLPQQQTNVSLVGAVSSAQAPAIMVPYGWKRLLNNGSVIYISPSNTALSSPEQVKDYLQTAGTCKCGLECPFKYESVFNFDPKVVSKPWILTPDSATGDLTKLCNHKRKIITMASLECKPPDPNMKIRKDINIKRKKRKITMPCGNILPQMITQDKFMRGPHPYNKDHFVNQQIWAQSAMNNMHFSGNRLQNFPDNRPNEQVMRINQESSDYESGSASPMMIGETMIVQQPHDSSNISQNSQNVGIQLHQHPNPNEVNRQMFSIRGAIPPNNQIQTSEMNPIGAGTVPVLPNGTGGIVIQGHLQNQAQRILVNGQPGDQNSPGRPGIQMMPFVNNPHNRQPVPCKIQGPQFYNNQYSQIQHYDNSKYIRPYLSPIGNNPAVNGFKSQVVMNPHTSGPAVVNSLQKVHWQNKLPSSQNQIVLPVQNSQASNMYERVPPLHQSSFTTVWQDEIKKKRSKLEKKRPYNMIDYHLTQHPPCPNIDVRQIPSENNRPMNVEQVPQNSQATCSPSFLEDPSGYLAQQTALLNSTINRQTGVATGFLCPNPNSMNQMNQVLPASADNMQNEMTSKQQSQSRTNQNATKQQNESSNHYGQILIQNLADSSALNDPNGHCKDCPADHFSRREQQTHGKPVQNYHRSSKSSTPCSPANFEDPVTSSTSDKGSNLSSPSTLPIQGGTISTSNMSSNDGTPSGHSTPVPHTPTPPQHNLENSQEFSGYSEGSQMYLDNHQLQNFTNMKEVSSSVNYSNVSSSKSETGPNRSGSTSATTVIKMSDYPAYSSVVTTMASGRTVGSNTITSVLAGRTNTATVSINNPMGVPVSTTPSLNHGAAVAAMIQTQTGNALMNKSPLEMVQSVVSSIQVPHSQHPGLVTSGVHANIHNVQANLQTSAAQIMKQTSSALPPGHIFVSSGGQLLMANTGTSHQPVMPPPPPPGSKMIPSSVSPIAASSMITNTNVTAAVTQMIPAVAQQVLGQQTVLVNALQAPFVLQPGVTMTMDGMTVGQNVQIPQLVTGNVIQHQIQIDNSDLRNAPNLLSPEIKKKGKKRKVSSQTVANMLQIAAQQNSNVVMPQQGFPQHIQMHSPQGLTAGSVMQALTLVPSKNNGAPQIVMNGQTISNHANHLGAQQLIANSQPQQINLLQPVNIINSGTGVVPNFPTIQQFILPNLGGMVMNPDGTATLLQDTSNLGMQLQIQTVNGQNVLTPVQNNPVFSAGQNIIASGPTGMVIRSPTSQGKIIQQQHSPGAQFLSPNSGQFVVNSPQFSGQISPLLTGVSPQQQVTFNTSPQQVRAGNSLQQSQQEFIHCGQLGQTLMVPCTPANSVSIASSSNQNTTYVQQNTTIVQQQTTMVSGNQQQVQEFSSNTQPSSSEVSKLAALNVDEKFLISSNDNKHLQAMIIQADSPNSSSIHRQSVSTQTAVNQNAHSVTTNTFCQTTTLSAGSPPDTTTHSPLSSSGEQSPPNADTTTHDGLSPSSSNCSGACEMPIQNRQEVPCTMPMVHCISSSEPDSAEIASHNNSDTDWSKHSFCSTAKNDYLEGKLEKKSYMSTHVTYPESSTVIPQLHYISGDMKNIENVGVSKQQQRRKKTQSGHHLHSSVIDD